MSLSKRGAGRQGLKPLQDVFIETRLGVACYTVKSSNKWTKVA